MWASIIAIAQQSKFDPPVGYIYISVTNYHPANVYGGSEDEWVTFGSGRMIMGADSQLPMTGGSEYITEAQLPAHDHSYSNGYQTTYGAHGAPSGSSYSSYGTLQQTLTTGSSGSGQAYYPKYIQTYMWEKVFRSSVIIYDAFGNAMGTIADLLDITYPLGSVVSRTSPVTTSYLFTEAQNHTWVQFAQGRTLVGQDATDTAFDGVTPTAYIGEKEHTLTKAEIPPHVHTENKFLLTAATSLDASTDRRGTNITVDTGDGSVDAAGNVQLQGHAHNNVQPYEVVYYYKRTA